MKGRGRHPHNALSAAFVSKVKKPGRYADGGGLYLVVDDNRAKRWELNIVIRGKRRYIGLGGVNTVSLVAAREEAQRLRVIRRNGGDPLAEKRRSKAPTFEQAAQQVHEAHKPSWKNLKHADQWLNTLHQYAFPIFGERRVDEVGTADVLKALSPIWLAKPETATRVLQRMNAVFAWAKASGHRPGDNPCDGMRKVLPKQRGDVEHHAALPYQQVPKFVHELRNSERVGLSVKLALEFLVLTFARTTEILQATWSEIDTAAALWVIPKERMKMRKEHRVPLSARCMEILEQARAVAHDAYIFPSGRVGKPLSNGAFLMTLKRMGVKTTAHGFRSSGRDWMSERTNFPREACELALAHAIEDKVEAAYRRGDLFEKRRELMDTWAGFVSATPGEVIALRAAR